jgi:hypothetical protein
VFTRPDNETPILPFGIAVDSSTLDLSKTTPNETVLIDQLRLGDFWTRNDMTDREERLRAVRGSITFAIEAIESRSQHCDVGAHCRPEFASLRSDGSTAGQPRNKVSSHRTNSDRLAWTVIGWVYEREEGIEGCH